MRTGYFALETKAPPAEAGNGILFGITP